MAYAVLTESDLLDKATGGADASRADRLATALTAMEEQGFVFAGVERAKQSEALFVFRGGDTSRRLGNIR